MLKCYIRFCYISFLLLVFFAGMIKAENPKREFRAAWIASVANLDWPYRYDSPATQQQKLKNTLDNLKSAGINAIILQVRPECDALYQSDYEPWSFWLTGTQGKAPSPFYDPLQFALDEAHKRGIEVHAWFNPYRAERSVGYFTLSPDHVVKQHPEWVLTFGSLKMLDPGLPMVRDHVTNVIMDVVNKYDVQGIHFDDYFYPYDPKITTEDQQTFVNYPRGFSNIDDWRRDNVNLLIAQIYDSIKAVKAYVKFGISPFGIWKNGVPPGIKGLDAYSEIYCDAVNWLQSEIVDYLTPQIYWQFGGDQDYGKLLPWWAAQTTSRHIYPGHAVYKISGWGIPQEMPNQVRLNRSTEKVHGSVYFRTNILLANPLGFRDSLRYDLYNTPALMPTMPWLDAVLPESPPNLTATGKENGIELNWTSPAPAADGDSARQYLLYKFRAGQVVDLTKPEHILAILTAGTMNYVDSDVVLDQSYTYVCTALDKLHNESLPSEVQIVYTGLETRETYIPEQFKLEQCFPNPFNPETTIRFSLPHNDFVSLAVYDIRGRLVESLVQNVLPAGEHQVRFNGRNHSSGTYIYVLEAEGVRLSRKMILIR